MSNWEQLKTRLTEQFPSIDDGFANTLFSNDTEYNRKKLNEKNKPNMAKLKYKTWKFNIMQFYIVCPVLWCRKICALINDAWKHGIISFTLCAKKKKKKHVASILKLFWSNRQRCKVLVGKVVVKSCVKKFSEALRIFQRSNQGNCVIYKVTKFFQGEWFRGKEIKRMM